MRRIPLNEFATEKSQVNAASLLGMTQGALSKALRVGRDIYVTEHDDGTYSAEEVKPFPSQGQPRLAS
ncbi:MULTISPECIES: Cro/CI family transcriptional regulator [unclassified Pseudomonas]|uniref:Cro/CI family transcriptional regulator n=1 Tax=unclassified Pseudomonas TaxID=196821 RepID=UPI00244BF1EF|nr:MULTISPECIES: Cro/CI family transcriptional regulator [unclassified Pseudomonas]MDG9928284.1 Cro/CI family transcriptional regulator [Pseudomonas sp. GD04042]MDH0481152.1 Cro/CI family transcriptional regulator [Pseudomonas sp. GD04015]MDH0604488.1 Cro/CI family transcriptional regulator [Pseudomonas sp. GD03869]